MFITTSSFLNSKSAKRLPEKILTHRYFNEQKKIHKIFPDIGLKNEIVKNAANQSPFGKLDLVFTSSGVRGIYDIATMSQRGVMSCMNWANNHSSHLIGSMVDPFCGMIYLTDNSRTEYGKSILIRCLIRLVVGGNGEPALFIERPYVKTANTDPHIYNNKALFPIPILDIFEKYLNKKVKLRIFHLHKPLEIFQMPYSRYLSGLCHSELTMSDGLLAYNTDPNIAKNWLAHPENFIK